MFIIGKGKGEESIMEELDLYKQLLLKNDLENAHLVIKNIFNRNLSDLEIFKEYIDFCFRIAKLNIDLETRKYYVTEIDTAIIFFSENGNLTVEVLESINKIKDNLIELSKEIVRIENELYANDMNELCIKNEKALADLSKLRGRVIKAKTQKEFDNLLIELSEKENELEKDGFSAQQNKFYEQLTKDYTNTISKKMEELIFKENLNYNKEALLSYKEAFDLFKGNEGIYKSRESELYNLATKKLFAYDSSKLFNETLIYYNNIYSYIFSKLDDNMKFKITELSINAAMKNKK